MDSSLDILARAFFESDPRIAVFDRAARKRVGLWAISDHAIPTSHIIAAFRECESFLTGKHLVIPLHEIQSAELTGTYVVCLEGDDESIGFFDYSENSPVFLSSTEFSRTAPALQLRYWHPSYRPAETPSYLTEYYSFHQDRSGSEPKIEPAGRDAIDQSIFDEMKLFIERQRDAHRNEVRETYTALGGKAYIDAHGGIPDLEPAGRRIDETGAQVCMLTRAQSEIDHADSRGKFGIQPGIEVLLDAVDQDTGFPVEGELLSIEENRFDFRVKWSTSDSHSAAEAAFGKDATGSLRVVPLLNPIPFDRQRQSVETIEGDDRKRGIVLGTHSLRFDNDRQITPQSKALNQYQQRAIRRSLGAVDVFCIHGPPGTGTTRTLRELIKEAIGQGEKVLVCAPSNHAIDRFLVGTSTLDRADPDSLHAAVQNGSFVMKRAGTQSQNAIVNERYQDVESWEANLVGATPNAAHEFRTNEFDLVVIDDAQRCGLPSSMIPFSRGDRLVLAGDHHQLPPFPSTESDMDDQPESSLFEHILDVYGSTVSTLLRKQYRMNEEIAAFPNQFYYDGKLTPGQRNRSWTIRDFDPLVSYHVTGGEDQTPSGSFFNEAEAAVVSTEVRRLLQSGVPASQIGVITPYSGQVGKVVQALDDPELKNRIKISTIDAFHGSERDAIIVSFVRSNGAGNTGFLSFPRDGPRRLNVALTRAKKRLVLIGDWETLRSAPADQTDASHVFDALFTHLQETGALRERHPPPVSRSQ